MKESKLAYLFIWILAISFAINFISRPKNFNPPFEKVVKVLVNEEMYGWQGSAVFIEDNLLLTAGHIVDGAVDIKIVTSVGKEYVANSWYLEEPNFCDIGFIVVDTNEIEAVTLFDNAEIGEDIWAIGNPFGVFPILTKGIISSTDTIDDYGGSKNMLVTDCPINPGNSGCALFDVDGNILGTCSWGYRNSQGMSYFVKSSIVKLALEKYKLNKKIESID